MLINKEKLIEELNAFADSLTVIGGSYIRSAIRVVVEPMTEAPEAKDLRDKLEKHVQTLADEIRQMKGGQA